MRKDYMACVILLGLALAAGCAGKHPLPLQNPEYLDYSSLPRKLKKIKIQDLNFLRAGCGFGTAAELLAACPTKSEIQEIRNDFNIWFDGELVDNGTLVPWSCSDGGNESSLMLSMYNSFRLMKCIPFDQNFTWAPEHNNLYDWLKSANLESIGYFWAEDGEYSHGWNKQVFLKANFLTGPQYRKVIDSNSGVGLIHAVVLIAHEARHADVNIGHNCDSNDTNLGYLGAWAVQYHLMKALSENTGGYFSAYEKQSLQGGAQQIYDTRFCDY